MSQTVPYKKADADRFAKLRSDFLEKHRVKQDYLISLAVKYGNEQNARSWGSRGEKSKLETLQRAEDRPWEKLFELITRLNPRRGFERGFPTYWIAEQLTWEDAITLGPMSVVPPSAYGFTAGEMQVRAGDLDQSKENRNMAGRRKTTWEGSNFVLSTGRRAKSRVGAHRATRTSRHLGASVNRGGMSQRDVDALWRIGTDNDRDWLRRNGMLPSWEKKALKKRSANRAGGKRRSENEYGLTFPEWLAAAGGSAHVESVISKGMTGFKAWRDGEDPTEYRAASPARRSA